MAHLWMYREEQWQAEQLGESVFELTRMASGLEGPLATDSKRHASKAALMVRTGAGGTQAWVLIASDDAGVRVNSEAPVAGLRVLADRDRIRTPDGRRLFFSTEALAQVEPFPGAERAVYCGRCRQQIETGAPAVRCPRCGVWYNQGGDLPCWTYAEKCVFCGRATALDTGYQWTPEDEA